MNAGAIRMFKKGVGEASTGNRCFNKNKTNKETGNKPVAHSFIQLTITEVAAEPLVSNRMVPSSRSPPSSGRDRHQ